MEQSTKVSLGVVIVSCVFLVSDSFLQMGAFMRLVMGLVLWSKIAQLSEIPKWQLRISLVILNN